jgi:hypothetical protein
VSPIRHDDEAQFLPGQELFDDDFAARRAELAGEHRLGGLDRRLHRLGDDHALARGKTAGFDHDRSALSTHVLGVERLPRERCVARRWNVVAAQKLLRVGLGAFQLRRSLAWAEALQSLRAELVNDPGDERRLGTHDREIDPFRLRQPNELWKVVRANVDVAYLVLGCRPCIARSDQHFGHPGRSGALPGEGVLAPAGSDDQYFHELAT